MNDTLLIKNVDFQLLDKQRLALAKVLMDKNVEVNIKPDDIMLLDGLLNMLDEWSDVVLIFPDARSARRGY